MGGRVFRGFEILGRPADEELVARLAAETGSPGIEEREDGARVRYRLYVPADAPADAGRRLRDRWRELGGAGETELLPFLEPERDWSAEARGAFRGTRVGPFWIGPPWASAPRGRLALRINPGRAFGTGLHATTRIALRLMCPVPTSPGRAGRGAAAAAGGAVLRGARVLDVGTGSGILALAGLALGAAGVTALDLDPHALANAAENRALNGGARRLHLVAGSPAALSSGSAFDLVLANLEAPILTGLLPELARVLAPCGRLLATGVTVEQRPSFLQAAARRGLRVRRRATEAGWWGALLEPGGPRPGRPGGTPETRL